MSTEKQTNISISSRLSHLIDIYTGGNVKKFAELSGINPVTLLNYSKGRLPKADALANICESFNININWLLTGKGAVQIHDQNCPPLDPDPEIASLMEGVRRVLCSGNPVAFDALERNIRYFDHAIAAEKRADAAELEIREMKKTMADIMQKVTELERDKARRKAEGEGQSSDKKVA